MQIQVLASGSSGNCYRVSDGNTALLIECGIPMKQIQKGLNFKLSEIDGVLISHSHGDHSQAVKDVLKAGMDVYLTELTKEALGVSEHRINIIEPKRQFSIGTFIIAPFETQHDCPGSVGFLIQSTITMEKLLFLTDSFYSKYVFLGLTHIMVEANYATDILYKNIELGLIPEPLKNRLLKSHFSLENVKDFLKANDLSKVKEIYLIHLSRGNSDEARFKREIQAATGKPVYIA
jgi:phosphoribosyl 1,2-cyclic phosphodiesterase